jgi:hypothetical protein
MPSIKSKKAVFFGNKQPLKDDIENFIYRWNALYPMDRWWRERHKVAFNSPEHRVVSFLDIYIEWKEDRLITKAQNASIKNFEYKSGDWVRERKDEISVDDEIRDFENMDLSQFDDRVIKK